MFMGCGSEENFGTEKMAQQLKELGIKLDVYASPGTHHEWLTWHRCFKGICSSPLQMVNKLSDIINPELLGRRFWDYFYTSCH